MALVFRSVKGSNLTPAEVDGNFHDLDDRIAALENNPVQPAQITDITANGPELTITLSNASEYTVPIPVVTMSWRQQGWQSGVLMPALEVFKVPGFGFFMSEREHVTEATFNPLATDIGGNPLYSIIFGVIEQQQLPYDISMNYRGPINANGDLLSTHVVNRQILLPANLFNSTAVLKTAVTDVMSIPILKNNVQIGSIFFEPDENILPNGYQAGEMNLADDTIFILNDVLSIGEPGAADATAAGLTVTFAASVVV